ncbi:metal-sensitive transcriptional regulator [Pediococcus acidilactici]|uniref:metal-sensitive transcriptional regulator n=1 Tax=Pediococcus acidilactici TaxID=1254 RepID=UPI000FFCC7A9|nr:metal-sensitive transcriptional regulator [Pediococcus acidilactici]QAR70797.1 metal-sensitive transcriptional regulator [Pediococcus acidilactici]
MATCDQQILNRLKRAEGQIRGIQKMITDGKECSEIIPQLNAVKSGVDRIKGIMVAENLKDCLENPANDKETQDEKIARAIEMIVKK